MKKSMVSAMDSFYKKIWEWIGEYGKFIILNTIFGILIYLMMISGNLVNNWDGIWHTSYSMAGAWETSLGRGILPYLDKLRYGVVSMPLNSTLTLLIISITSSLILDIFAEKRKTLGILITMIIIANPVTCVTLSYCYTSVNYGLAFLFSVIAVKCICCEHGVAGALVGSCFIALSLGCYQAYFDVACLLVLLLLIKKLLQNAAIKEIKIYVFKSIFAIMNGGFIYFILTKLLLKKYGITLASYRGASEISIRNIVILLPASIRKCYQCFYDFFVRDNMYIRISGIIPVLLMGMGIIILLCIIRHFFEMWHRNKIYAISFLGCICLVPVACNAIILIAVGNNIDTLMAMGMVLTAYFLVPLLAAKGKFILTMKRLSIVLMACFLWLNILTVTNDQLALKDGKTATVGLTEAIVHKLIEEGYLEDGAEVAFVGTPWNNDLFIKRKCWNNANGYAKFGNWWIEADNNRSSWSGVLAEYCGINLNQCSAGQYWALYQNEEVMNMPLFPKEGSVKKIDGVVVVKVSESYHY